MGRAVFRWRAIWVCLALTAAIVVVYAPVRHFGLVNWDDPTYVGANPNVIAGLTWQGVLWAFRTGLGGNWHPVTWLSFMIDVQLYGLNAGGLHVTNVLLHIANTLLLFGLFFRMTGALGRSGFVAGLFALHPLHVESVAWVTERKDVLSTFFGILAIWAYVDWVRRPGWKRYGALLLLFALSLASKPMLVTLPLVLLLLDFWPLGRVAAGAGPDQRVVWLRLLREKLPLFAVAVVCGIVTIVAQRAKGAVINLDVLPFADRAGNAIFAYLAYIGKMVWPVRLAAFYPLLRDSSAKPAFAAVVVVAAVSFLVVRAARSHSYFLVGWLWYLVTLVPVIGLVQAGYQDTADRYTYVPLIGLFLMVAWGIPDLLARWPARSIPLAAAAGLILAGCAIAANRQVQYWRDSVSLWTHTLDVTPEHYITLKNLALGLADEGKIDQYIFYYTRALKLGPDNADAQNNFANLLAHHDKLNESFAHYFEALRIRPNFAEAHSNLANALARQGKTSEAIVHYSEALRIKPDYADAHNGLGALLAGQGKVAEALGHYSEALRINPGLADAHNNIGALLAAQGKTDEAIREFSEAVRISPAKADFHYNLGVMLQKKGQINEARDEFNTALRLNPDYQQARRALDALGSSSTAAPGHR